MHRRSVFKVILALSLWVGLAGIASAATLWSFLGIPQGLSALRNGTVNRRGNFPGLEKKPPLKPIGDPENLKSNNPAIKKAAEVKQEEDKKKQKIKALKYLAKMGCGCYPGVKEALMDALDDCTEAVRQTAAEQIAKAAENKCEVCQKTCCCDEEMTKKLAEIAYERDESGCFIEPSEDVREAAAEAMRACCRASNNQRRGGVPIATPRQPYTTPIVEPIIPIEPTPGDVIEPTPNDMENTPDTDDDDDKVSRRRAPSSKTVAHRAPSQPDVRPSRPVRGSLVGVDLKTGTVAVEFGSGQPGVGSHLEVSRHFAFETVDVGEVEIVYLAKNGRAIARPVGRLGVTDLAKGDIASYRPVNQPQRAAEATTVSIADGAPPAAGQKVHRASSKSASSKSVKSAAKGGAPKRRTNAVPARPTSHGASDRDDYTASCSDAEDVETVVHVSDEVTVAPASYPKTREHKAPARLPPPNKLRER